MNQFLQYRHKSI